MSLGENHNGQTPSPMPPVRKGRKRRRKSLLAEMAQQYLPLLILRPEVQPPRACRHWQTSKHPRLVGHRLVFPPELSNGTRASQWIADLVPGEPNPILLRLRELAALRIAARHLATADFHGTPSNTKNGDTP